MACLEQEQEFSDEAPNVVIKENVTYRAQICAPGGHSGGPGQRLIGAPTKGLIGIHGFLGIFGDFSGIFGIFGQILGFLVKIRSESCRRLRDLQKSIVILSNGAVLTRNASLLKKSLPLKK